MARKVVSLPARAGLSAANIAAAVDDSLRVLRIDLIDGPLHDRRFGTGAADSGVDHQLGTVTCVYRGSAARVDDQEPAEPDPAARAVTAPRPTFGNSDQPTVAAPTASTRTPEQLADLLPVLDLRLTDDELWPLAFVSS